MVGAKKPPSVEGGGHEVPGVVYKLLQTSTPGPAGHPLLQKGAKTPNLTDAIFI